MNVHQNRKFKTEGFHITWCDHKLVWEVSVVLNNRPQYTYAYFVPRASGKKQFDFIPKFSLNPKWNLCPFSFLPANPELILWRSWAIMGLFRLMVRACPEFYDVFEKKKTIWWSRFFVLTGWLSSNKACSYSKSFQAYAHYFARSTRIQPRFFYVGKSEKWCSFVFDSHGTRPGLVKQFSCQVEMRDGSIKWKGLGSLIRHICIFWPNSPNSVIYLSDLFS